MTVSNIGLASIVSDPFGKTAQAVMNEVLSTEVINEDKITKIIHHRCKNKDKILESLKNFDSIRNLFQSHNDFKTVEVEIVRNTLMIFYISSRYGIQLLSSKSFQK